MVKIAFWDNSLSERGTTVSLYSYAYYNETILGNESIIMYNTTRSDNATDVITIFKKKFKVFGVDNFASVDQLLMDNKCDILYVIKSGEYEGHISKVCKTVVHCVFTCKQPHGDVYAPISRWVHDNHNNFPTVPHMINLPDNNENMRKELNIPEDAIVFGRHGGVYQFDIEYVHNIVYNVSKNHPNIYFLFLNTKRFCEPLPNILHIEQIVDLEKKVSFINTCDAMLWARKGGESFGLAIGEFSIKNKPVIATKDFLGDIAHIHLLGEKAIWYNQLNLYNILTTFDREVESKKDWNAFREYTPENVIQIFKKIFIDAVMA
jgi:hypothetical protein